MKNTYSIDMSDEDNSMHLSKDGGPTICTDFHAAAGLADFLRLCEDANIGASSREPKADPKEKELKDKIMEILLSCDREWEFYDERTCHVEKGKDFDYDVAADRIAKFIVTLPK